MPVRGEVHSFGSALARDELARLMEGGACLDIGAASLLIEHLELCSRERDLVARACLPRKPSERRTGLSFTVHLCQLLLRAIRRSGGSGDTYRRLHP